MDQNEKLIGICVFIIKWGHTLFIKHKKQN